MMIGVSLLLVLTVFSCMSHFHDTLHIGLMVWYRDNIGFFIQHIILQSCLLTVVVRLRRFLDPTNTFSDEVKVDHVLRPLYVLMCFILTKIFFLTS